MYFNLQKEGHTEPHTIGAISNVGAIQDTANNDPASRAEEQLGLYEGIGKISFEHVKELALDCAEEILEHWLPDGEQRGKQYVACNPTRDDGDLGSFTINTESGVWADFATTDDSGGDLISLIAYLEGCETQTDAAVKILKVIAGLKTDDGASIVKRNTERKAKPKSDFTVVMPIPDEALVKRQTYFGPDLGSPVATWEYKNEAGQLMFFVHRFNTAHGKSFLPQTYCKDSSGWTIWKNMAPPLPRPAYGLHKLTASPDAPVLFTEGEKSADAAQRLFAGHVTATTMNGSKSPQNTDFKPFAGRKVYIAPDNDEAGAAYKDKLIELLSAAGAKVEAVLRLDALVKNGVALAAGYDLADAEADGWTAEELAKLGEGLWEAIVIDPPPTPATEEKSSKKPCDKEKTKPVRKETVLERAIRFGDETFHGQLAFTHNQFRAYEQGYWPVLDTKVDVERKILRFLGAEATPTGISTITSLLSTANAIKPTEFERPKTVICVQNGTLNPLTGKLSAHVPDDYLTNKMDIEWNTDAACPLWLQTLDEIFSLDADKADKIRLLQEFMGYCLVPMTHMHKFLWMVGGGGNGKSLILAILTALIGPANISFAQIERLQEKFVRSELCGKLVNISSEMSAQATIADGYFKQIVSGDVIEAERKQQPSFSFKPYSRMIGATNELPRLLDHSDGFFRRAMILPFTRQFKEEEQDKGRENRLMAELPGILKWAVEGLQALLARGNFVIPPSSADEVAKYRINSDPIRQFADECIVVSENRSDYITPAVLHKNYQEWCKTYGYQAVGVNKLTDRLKGLGFNPYKSGGARLWKIKFTAPAEYDRGDDLVPAKQTSPLASRYIV